MRVATFNTLSGRSPQDHTFDEERYRRAVRMLDADILGLQEVDRNQPRSQYADLTAIAAEEMGATDHLFVAALAGSPATWSAATGDEQPDEATYGIALLSRYPARGWRVIRLPGAPVPVPHRFQGRHRPTWVRDEPRVAVAAEVDSPLGRLTVVNTHLSFLSPWNRRQLRRLMAGLGRTSNAVILLGDLNMGPAPAGRISRMRPLARGATFPSGSPREQIDHILTDGPWATEGTSILLPMSDHRALLTVL